MNKRNPINMQIARRSFLKGLAGAGALSAMQVEKLFAQTSAPLRVMFVTLHNGWGTGKGALGNISGSEFNFQLPAFWEPFNAIKDDCIFIDGLRGTFWGNAHDVSYSDVLTAGVPINARTDQSLGGPFPKPVNASIDHVLEKHYNMPAMRFSVDYATWGAPYHPTSFNDRLENLPFYRTPREAYNSLFNGMGGGGGGTPQADPVIAELFPHLSDEANRIVQSVETTQRNKLLNYLDAVSAMEQKLGSNNPPVVPGGSATLKRIPTGNEGYGQKIDSYLDMIRVGFTNDTHRVAILGMGELNNDFQWTDANGNDYTGYSAYTGDFHHQIAHFNEYRGDNEILAYYAWIEYYTAKITGFVQELQNTIDFDGNRLIDNTIIVLTGEVGHGMHDTASKPHVVIGGGNRVQRGRWYRTPRINCNQIGSLDENGNYRSIRQTLGWDDGDYSEYSHADLFTRIAQMAGLNINSFGIDRLNVAPLDI